MVAEQFSEITRIIKCSVYVYCAGGIYIATTKIVLAIITHWIVVLTAFRTSLS